MAHRRGPVGRIRTGATGGATTRRTGPLMRRAWLAAALLAPMATRADIGQDKVEHAAFSAVYGLMAGMTVENRWHAFALALAPGLAKEIVDSRTAGNHFSTGDLAADAIGAAAGVWLGSTLIRPTKNGLAFQVRFR